MAQRKQHNRVNDGALRTGGGAAAADLRALEERAMVEEVVVVVSGGCFDDEEKRKFWSRKSPFMLRTFLLPLSDPTQLPSIVQL